MHFDSNHPSQHEGKIQTKLIGRHRSEPPVLLQVLLNIQSINGDAGVHGLIVQLPLDAHRPMDSGRVTDAVAPHKDVDGWVVEAGPF